MRANGRFRIPRGSCPPGWKWRGLAGGGVWGAAPALFHVEWQVRRRVLGSGQSFTPSVRGHFEPRSWRRGGAKGLAMEPGLTLAARSKSRTLAPSWPRSPIIRCGLALLWSCGRSLGAVIVASQAIRVEGVSAPLFGEMGIPTPAGSRLNRLEGAQYTTSSPDRRSPPVPVFECLNTGRNPAHLRESDLRFAPAPADRD